MRRAVSYLWAGVALVILAHLLIDLAVKLWPLVVVGCVMVAVYTVMFKRRM